MAVYRARRPTLGGNDPLGGALINLSDAMRRARRRREERERWEISNARAERAEARAIEAAERAETEAARSAVRWERENQRYEREEQARLAAPEAADFLSKRELELEQSRFTGEIDDLEYARQLEQTDEQLSAFLKEQGFDDDTIRGIRPKVIANQKAERDRVEAEARRRASEARAAATAQRAAELQPFKLAEAKQDAENSRLLGIQRRENIEAKRLEQVEKEEKRRREGVKTQDELIGARIKNEFQQAFEKEKIAIAADPGLTAGEKNERIETLVQQAMENADDIGVSKTGRDGLELEIRSATAGDLKDWISEDEERAKKAQQKTVADESRNRGERITSLARRIRGSTPEEQKASLDEFSELEKRWEAGQIPWELEDRVSAKKELLGSVVREAYRDGVGEQLYDDWASGDRDEQLALNHPVFEDMTSEEIEDAFTAERARLASAQQGRDGVRQIGEQREERRQQGFRRGALDQLLVAGQSWEAVERELKRKGASGKTVKQIEKAYQESLKTEDSLLDRDPLTMKRVAEWSLDLTRVESPGEIEEIMADAWASLIGGTISAKQYGAVSKAASSASLELAEEGDGAASARTLMKSIESNFENIYIDRNSNGEYVAYMPGREAGLTQGFLEASDDRDVQRFVRGMTSELAADGEYRPGSMEDRAAHLLVRAYIAQKAAVGGELDAKLRGLQEPEEWDRLGMELIQQIRRQGIQPGFESQERISVQFQMFREQNEIMKFSNGVVDERATFDAVKKVLAREGATANAARSRSLYNSAFHMANLLKLLSTGADKAEPIKRPAGQGVGG